MLCCTVIVLHESLCYDLDKGVLQYGSQEIVLTRTEHKILQILARNRGSIVSREELMMQIWSTDEFISDGRSVICPGSASNLSNVSQYSVSKASSPECSES